MVLALWMSLGKELSLFTSLSFFLSLFIFVFVHQRAFPFSKLTDKRGERGEVFLFSQRAFPFSERREGREGVTKKGEREARVGEREKDGGFVWDKEGESLRERERGERERKRERERISNPPVRDRVPVTLATRVAQAKPIFLRFHAREVPYNKSRDVVLSGESLQYEKGITVRNGYRRYANANRVGALLCRCVQRNARKRKNYPTRIGPVCTSFWHLS